jgi:hypothetical protein
MAEPTRLVRRGVFDRDQHRCIRCGAVAGLEFQHRRAEGMGGRRSTPPKFSEGLVACTICNNGFEAQLQRTALYHGWKLRSWVIDRFGASAVPVYDAVDRQWYRLVERVRRPVSVEEAAFAMRHVYGNEWESWAA